VADTIVATLPFGHHEHLATSHMDQMALDLLRRVEEVLK